MQLALKLPGHNPCTAQLSITMSEQTLTNISRRLSECVAMTPTSGASLRVADETSELLAVQSSIRQGTHKQLFTTSSARATSRNCRQRHSNSGHGQRRHSHASNCSCSVLAGYRWFFIPPPAHRRHDVRKPREPSHGEQNSGPAQDIACPLHGARNEHCPATTAKRSELRHGSWRRCSSGWIQRCRNGHVAVRRHIESSWSSVGSHQSERMRWQRPAIDQNLPE